MVLTFSGAYLLSTLATLYNMAFTFFTTPLFTVGGTGVSLFTVLVFSVGVSLVIRLIIIIFGGDPERVD